MPPVIQIYIISSCFVVVVVVVSHESKAISFLQYLKQIWFNFRICFHWLISKEFGIKILLKIQSHLICVATISWQDVVINIAQIASVFTICHI